MPGTRQIMGHHGFILLLFFSAMLGIVLSLLGLSYAPSSTLKYHLFLM
jgi:hypothetical protein